MITEGVDFSIISEKLNNIKISITIYDVVDEIKTISLQYCSKYI